MLFDRVEVVADHESGAWPFTIPAVRDVAAHGLTLTSNITVFMGANGSGKSTLLEAIAEAYGMDVRGGHGARKYGRQLNKSPLGEALRLSRTGAGSGFTGRGAKGFFLRAETAFGMLAFMTEVGVAGYGGRLSYEVSHGESYLQAIQGRFAGSGLYLLDEAEGPLSFESTLVLLYQLRELADARDVQVIYSTHSPLVAAIPGAQILELTDDGIAQRDWDELATVGLWQTFLRHPQRFFAD
jgi:predicted ATPase